LVYNTLKEAENLKQSHQLLAAPTIHYPAENNTALFVSPGHEFRVVCEAVGIPPPRIEWTRVTEK
jgi:hypothetical protein